VRSPSAVDAVEEASGGALAFRSSFVRIGHRAFLSLNWADGTSLWRPKGHARKAILSTQRPVSSDNGGDVTTGAATTPLGKILTADEIARFVARVAYPTCPVVLVDEELALAAPARACGDWRGALVLPDLAEKARMLLPETAGGRAAADTAPDSGRGA
jgi:hypothetical protein